MSGSCRDVHRANNNSTPASSSALQQAKLNSAIISSTNDANADNNFNESLPASVSTIVSNLVPNTKTATSPHTQMSNKPHAKLTSSFATVSNFALGSLVPETGRSSTTTTNGTTGAPNNSGVSPSDRLTASAHTNILCRKSPLHNTDNLGCSSSGGPMYGILAQKESSRPLKPCVGSSGLSTSPLPPPLSSSSSSISPSRSSVTSPGDVSRVLPASTYQTQAQVHTSSPYQTNSSSLAKVSPNNSSSSSSYQPVNFTPYQPSSDSNSNNGDTAAVGHRGVLGGSQASNSHATSKVCSYHSAQLSASSSLFHQSGSSNLGGAASNFGGGAPYSLSANPHPAATSPHPSTGTHQSSSSHSTITSHSGGLGSHSNSSQPGLSGGGSSNATINGDLTPRGQIRELGDERSPKSSISHLSLLSASFPCRLVPI